MLQVRDLEVGYGDLTVLRGVSLVVEKGAIVTLIGANGAGKSTLLRTLAGLNRPSSGSAEFLGKDLCRCDPQAIVELGLALVPEGRGVFRRMTVRENLEMGGYPSRARAHKEDTMEWVVSLFEPLGKQMDEPAGVLSGGLQQMLVIGRALMSRPDFLMLDEPSLGLAPLVVKMLFEVVSCLREQGLTVLLVEQNVRRSLDLADRGYVMQNGRTMLEGTAADLRGNPEVQRAFLGMGGDTP